MSYTKGPWKAYNRVQYDNDEMHPFSIMAKNTDFIARIIKEYPNVPAESNANLIAAAPDLLEACKESLDLLYVIAHKLGSITQGTDLDTLNARKMIEKAISKAEGRDGK